MNELIKRSDAILIIQNTNYKYPTWPHIVEAKENMIRDVKSAPTVDAVPVVRGEWIVTNGGAFAAAKCSECGFTIKAKYGLSDIYSNHYCPNCGADMRGREDT